MQLTLSRTYYDRALLYIVFSIALIGIVMVASASIAISERLVGHPFYFLIRQGCFFGIGIILAYYASRIPMAYWFEIAPTLLLIGLSLLVLVLIPGIGREVNGSRRWISLGFFGLQVSELMKLCMVVYLASYLERYYDPVRTTLIGFMKPLFLVAVVSFLLLLQPDFGAVVVTAMTSLGMLFLAGVRLWHFSAIFVAAVGAFVVLAISSPYRLERLTTFLNPWADQFDSGYQLTQALIAFGRGEWLGVGLGDSVQKLFYLPEAHTDFLFAVIGEELGMLGLFIVMLLFLLLIVRGLMIGHKAIVKKQLFAGFMAYGISLWLGMQAVVSMGVNTGLLPTKGLTLPLMSYGGSSLLISLIAVGLLLRINSECEQGAKARDKK